MKIVKICVVLAFLFGALSLGVYAEEEDELSFPEGYEELEKYLPQDVLDLLPKGLFSSDPQHVADALSDITEFDYVGEILADLLNVELKSSIQLLALLCGGMMLCSLLNNLGKGTLSGAGGEINEFVGNLLIVAILLTSQESIFDCAQIFFGRLNAFMGAYLPILCAMSAMGGGIASALCANYGISAFLGLSEIALAQTITPIVGTCVGLAAAGGVGETGAGSSLLKVLKNSYVFLIGMLMTVMLFVFSARGIMASGADSLGGRAIKFAAGNFIPIVGANIGEILKGVGSGIVYLKNTSGVVAVVILFLMLLPTFISVLMRRAVLSVSAAFADLLGVSAQSRLVREFSSIYGMLLAVISMCAVLFIAAIIITVKIGNAVI